MDIVTIDQDLNKGRFTSLGVFDFGTTAKVELTNNQDEFWRSVAFDAVKFVPVAAPNASPYTPSNPSPQITQPVNLFIRIWVGPVGIRMLAIQ